MKVKVADSAGFCMGVRNAMDSVLEAAHGTPVTYTLGPLIHNPQALRMLESRNIYIVDEINESLAGKKVVIRAHGTTIGYKKKLKEIGAQIVDATCPKVLRSQSIIKKYYENKYSIVIVGDRGHAEIDSLLSYADSNAKVVDNIEEAQKLPFMKKVCVIAQTTFNSAHYHKIAEEICRHAEESFVADTVCASTQRRQADILKLAKVTDATVVVGGKNSANTKRLADMSGDLGQPTFLIEEPGELNLEELSQYNEIGVTAGASTPNWVIKQVVDSIAGYTPHEHWSFYSLLMSLAFFAIEGNFVICAGAAALTYAMCLFMSIPPYPFYPLISFFYLFPLHAVNKFFEINWKQISATKQAPRLRKYWRIYLTIGFCSFLMSLGIAWYSSLLTFLLVTFSYLLGGFYSVHVIPTTWNFRFKSLRDIPGSKDIFIAAAWTFAVIILPSITFMATLRLITFVCGLFVFILVITRTSILAIGCIHSDKLIGLETIPVFIGRKKTIIFLYTANIFMAVMLIILSMSGLISTSTLILLVSLIYMVTCIKFLSSKGQFFTLYHQMILDAVFFITGILSFLFLG